MTFHSRVAFKLPNKLKDFSMFSIVFVVLPKKMFTVHFFFFNWTSSLMENNSFTCSTGFFLPG